VKLAGVRAPTDRELVLRAQAGEVAALGALLERHEAVLKAAALRRLRDLAAADDAVQETFLLALRRVGDLRDAPAARAWLLAILHNVCRMAWRAAPPSPLGIEAAAQVPGDVPAPEDHVERLAAGEWLWTALQELPEPLRATVLLRHFGSWSSYEQIAQVLGIPVGTVRSRLSLARARLAAELRATADAAHTEARALSGRQAGEFRAAVAELNAGTGCRAMVELYADDVRAHFSDGTAVRGRRVVRASMEDDLAAGARMHVTRVLASGSVTVVEARLENAPDHPFRCPPATCQVHLRRHGRTEEVRLHFAPRESASAPALAAA
jgi:RNA polymerase sigma-70 factor (ECF subfamily)